MTSLKTILDAVMGESGFQIPTSYASSPNPDDVQLVHLANAAADELRDLGLVQSRVIGSITLTAATDYALPVDFHAYVPDTMYGGGKTWPADMPVSPSDWAFLTASGVSDASFRCRFLGARLSVKNPVAGTVLSFEYVSSYPWTDAGGAAKEAATADTDLWRLDRRLLQMAVKWRWKKEKGLEDWKDDAQLFGRYINTLRARNSGAQTLCFGESSMSAEPYTNLWVN